METVISILIVVVGAIFIRKAYLFYAHMFQLNSYFNNRFMSWLNSNYTKKSPILHTNYDRKIPLKFTDRVKRLTVTYCIVNILFIVCELIAFDFSAIETAVTVVVLYFATPVMIIACNMINKPIEGHYANWYINDAKNILKAHKNLKIIGITGSFGKTSVKHFLTELLKSEYETLMTPGNFNTTMGVVRTVREYLKPTHQVFVCEMGAKKEFDIKEICDLVEPDMAIITSIGEQHLETFKSVETIIKTKFELADAVKGKGPVFLNYENEFIRNKEMNQEYKAYALNSESDFYSKNISFSNDGTKFTFVVKETGQEQEYSTKLIGEHNILNLTVAIGVCYSLGMDLQKLVTYVRKIEPVEHRLELKHIGGMTIIDDAYNSNPLGAKMALDALSNLDGRRFVITPGMVELGDKQYELNFELGKQCLNRADEVLLVGEEQTKPIYAGLIESGFNKENIKIFNTFKEAYFYAQSQINVYGKVSVLFENDLPDNF